MIVLSTMETAPWSQFMLLIIILFVPAQVVAVKLWSRHNVRSIRPRRPFGEQRFGHLRLGGGEVVQLGAVGL